MSTSIPADKSGQGLLLVVFLSSYLQRNMTIYKEAQGGVNINTGRLEWTRITLGSLSFLVAVEEYDYLQRGTGRCQHQNRQIRVDKDYTWFSFFPRSCGGR